MTYPILTPYQGVELLIKNDERNVRDVVDHGMYGMVDRERHATVIADCAARLFQAREVDHSRELERKAERNLRAALRGGRDR